MSFAELGSLGELLAAFGVIASLIFVGVQMRLNTRELRLQRKFESNEEWSRYRRLLIENADVADIFDRAVRDPESLDRIEALRFNMIMREHLRLTENQYERAQLGYTSMNEWEQAKRQARALLRSPVGTRLWEATKYGYLEGFVEEIDGDEDDA
jgi:hypothetical protein